MAERPGVEKGMLVRSPEGVPLGRVMAVDAEGFVLERRVVYPQEVRLGLEDVAALEGQDVILAEVPPALRTAPLEPGRLGAVRGEAAGEPGAAPPAGAWQVPE